jgi:hypothetical protein
VRASGRNDGFFGGIAVLKRTGNGPVGLGYTFPLFAKSAKDGAPIDLWLDEKGNNKNKYRGSSPFAGSGSESQRK